MSKILYTASTVSHINNFHRDYIEALRNDGHTVLVMANGEGADFNIPFKKKIFARENSRCRKAIRKILKREKFDAVILNTTLAAFHIRLAMPKKNRPTVVNFVHGYLFSKNTGFVKRKLFLFCERLLASKTDTVIVMNGEDLEIAKAHKLCKGEVFMCCGMGVKRKPVSEENVKKLRTEYPDKFVMSFVGELSGRKNQEFLIRAVKIINEKSDGVCLWLVGDGEERENQKALARELGISENVRFFGAVPNPCDFISASDLYVSASVIEGLPFNILEAMSCRMPVLASNIKGHTDIVCDGETGMLFPFGDTDAFVERVMEYREGLVALEKGKIESAYEKYSFENVFPKTLAILKESVNL